MSGPFDTEIEAQQAASRYTGPPGASNPVTWPDANRAMIMDAVNAAGLVLGDYDRHIIEWLANAEPPACAVIASLIARAAEPVV